VVEEVEACQPAVRPRFILLFPLEFLPAQVLQHRIQDLVVVVADLTVQLRLQVLLVPKATLHIPAPHNPQLDIAIQQMAQAMAFLAQNSVAPPRSTCTSLRAPDTFDGSNPSKFTTFMSLIYLHITECPQDFPTDNEKIFYVWSYLCGMAQQWFQPNIFAGGQVPIPHWDGNWELFVQELASNFGPHDPFGDVRISLETLSMKPGDPLATYQLKFDTRAVMTGYNEAALFWVFYRSLPSRIKDTMVQDQLPVSLAGLKPSPHSSTSGIIAITLSAQTSVLL
jgi:hypothetical protein